MNNFDISYNFIKTAASAKDYANAAALLARDSVGKTTKPEKAMLSVAGFLNDPLGVKRKYMAIGGLAGAAGVELANHTPNPFEYLVDQFK